MVEGISDQTRSISSVSSSESTLLSLMNPCKALKINSEQPNWEHYVLTMVILASRISPSQCLEITNPGLQRSQIPNPEKPTGHPLRRNGMGKGYFELCKEDLWFRRLRSLPNTLKGYSHDNGITFILKRVHPISIYFSIFVNMIPKRHFVPVQVVRE